MEKCPKCGSTDIAVIWYKKGNIKFPNDLIYKQDKFIQSQDGDFGTVTLNEHLTYHCRKCQYAEADYTLDNKESQC